MTFDLFQGSRARILKNLNGYMLYMSSDYSTVQRDMKEGFVLKRDL